MKKLIGIVLGLLTLSLFAGIAWLLYSSFGTTVVVILNVIIVMIGVFLGLIVYTRFSNEATDEKIKKSLSHYPALEQGKIIVNVQSFCDKLDPMKGNLYLATNENVAQNVSIRKAEYNKLLDEFSIIYSDRVKTKMRGVKGVAVGNNQFLIYDFEEMIHFDGKSNVRLYKERQRITEEIGKNTSVHLLPKNSPVYIFDWSHLAENEDD